MFFWTDHVRGRGANALQVEPKCARTFSQRNDLMFEYRESMEDSRHTGGERPQMLPFFEGETDLGATEHAAVLGGIQVVRPLGDVREIEHHERHMPRRTAHRQACQVSAHQEASLGLGGILKRARGRFCLELNRPRRSSTFRCGAKLPHIAQGVYDPALVD